ncbi:MAG TPA: histidine phosphatase family protein, partial [Flexilinea sp.]|nr:histidine phosphatase family protein [Flexilinea sp.]
MTRFCLIRHGQTDWNLEGRYQGQSDIPLNSTGIKQARLIARVLRDEQFDAVYSSDLLRALRTAEIITEYHDSLKINTDPRLREVNQGEWEGLTRDAIRDRYPKIWEALIENPVSVRPPGGETVVEVQSRV